MNDRAFWKFVAVGAVLGLFAIAYGLCRSSQLPSPSFATTTAYGAEGTPEKVRSANRPYLNFQMLFASQRIFRAKVKGGWLVLTEGGTGVGNPGGVGITFYPDPNHEWNGGTMK